MNVFMRGVVRRTTVGLGALALAAGAAACGGGGEQEPAPEEPSVEVPAGDEGDGEPSDAGGEQPAPGTEPSDGGGMFEGDEDPAGASDGGGDSAETEGELSEEEIGAATERFVEFLEAVEDHDAEAACSMLLNPETGQTGDETPECVEIFEQQVMPQVEGGEYQDLDASMVEPEDNGDGTVTMNLDGAPFGLPMGQGEDGAWYVTAGL